MFWSKSFARALIGLTFWLVILPLGVAVSRQEQPPDEASPAARHAQVIAHGVAEMPAGEIGWRVDVKRAVIPGRAIPEAGEIGFVLASDGLIAISDDRGNVLTRLAPGEAAWNDGSSRAVISLAGKTIDYTDIALIPARPKGSGGNATTHDPFAAPVGAAFDIDLIRDVLDRGEESVIPAGSGPMLILVTDGRAFVGLAGGEFAEIAAGGTVQADGDVVVTGASRAPASFVVARIGAEAPAEIALREGFAASPAAGVATPIPAATPVAAPIGNVGGAASVSIAVFYCAAGYATRDFAADCTDPASGVTFDLASTSGKTATFPVNDDGTLVFPRFGPGDYTIAAVIPSELALSRVSCRASNGAEVFTDSELNQATLTVDTDGAACDWFILLAGAAGEDADADADGLSDARELTLGALPFLPDSDDDGLNDGDEADFYGTDLVVADTDDDGLADGEEVLTHATNPLIADTDGDDVEDAREIAVATDPLDPLSSPATPAPTSTPAPERKTLSPAISLPDDDATPRPLVFPTVIPTKGATSASPSLATPAALRNSASGPAIDNALDGDGLATLDEINLYGTDPLVPDTDGDGVDDGAEIAAETNPLDPRDR